MRFMADGRLKEIFTEKCVLQALNNPGIIKFHRSFGSQNKFYLLMDYCQPGCLTDFMERLKTLALPLARHIAGEIILALEYMHSMGVIHRDLKPGNVVLDKRFHIKLIDFATCKVLNP